MEQDKKRVFSAIQPTGGIRIGNYIGAVRNMVAMQDEYECLYAVADLHSLTVDIAPAALRKNTIELAALLIAAGIDPEKSIFFVQSQVHEHAELGWVLNCYAQFGEARRMTQFKDKSAKAPENVNVGLFDYPVLMAADILLYMTDYVPVGKDQVQHLELSRTIAERFNNRNSPTFKVPEAILPKFGQKVRSLVDPTAKMSKSDSDPNGYVLVLDRPEDIARKFKRAVTDSDARIVYAPEEKPGISNLLTIYSAFADADMEESVKRFEGRDYAYLKSTVADAVIEGLRPIRESFDMIMRDKNELMKKLETGAEKASYIARRTMSKVWRKLGCVRP